MMGSLGKPLMILAPQPGNPRNSEGAFAELAGGKMLFAWTRFTGGSGDAASAHIVAVHSTDGGRSWSREPRELVANAGGCNVMSVSFVRLVDQRLGLFYLVKHGAHDCRPHVRWSDDHASTWSDAQPLTSDVGYHVVNNDRVVRLASGRLVVPAARHTTVLDAAGQAVINPVGRPLMFLSDDQGATWRTVDTGASLTALSRAGLQEPGVVELSANHLWCFCRSDVGHQVSLFSDDGGEHWSAPQPSPFFSPCSPMSVKRLADGRLLAVWNDLSPRWPFPQATQQSWGRTPLVIATSTDDGKTWTPPQPIETDHTRGFCYTAIHPRGKGTALLAYCAGGPPGMVLDTLVMRKLET